MSFAAYIRLFLESVLYILLSSFSELYRLDFSSKNRKISFVLACVFIWLSFVFYSFIIYQFCVTRQKLKRAQYSYSEELFVGLKETNMARTYSILLVTRRITLCIFLVCLQDLHFFIRVYLFAIVQIIYFVLLIAIRPYKQIENNMIEIINELSLSGLIAML